MIPDNANRNDIKKNENIRIIQSIYNHINEILFLHDLDGNFILTNTYFKEFTGNSIFELKSKNLHDYIADNHKLEFEDYLQRIKSNGYDEGIIHIVSKEGHVIAVEYKSTLLEVPENPKCVNVICRDITEEFKALNALKQSQKELKEREEKYRDIFENINAGVYIHDLDGDFIDINKHFITNIGYSKSEIINKNIRDFIPENYKTEFDEYLKRIKISGYENGVFKIKPKNKDALLVEYVNSVIYGEDGPVAVRGVARDVNKQYELQKAIKISEKKLKENEAKYRDIFENINAYIYIHDLEGNYIETNFYFIKMMGYPENELKTRNIRDLMPVNYKPKFDEYLKRIKANGCDEGINKLLTKDGSIRVVEYTNSLIYGDKGPIGIRGLAKDITQQYKSRNELEISNKKREESEKKYRDIFENINEYIYLHNVDGYFVDTNTHFRNNIGFSKSELRKINLRDMIPEKYKSGFDDYLKRIMVSGYEKGLLRIVSKNGRELLVEYKNSLVQGLEGPLFVRGVGRDITAEHEARKALKKSEENLRIARDELEKRVQERTKELRDSNEKLEEKTLSLEEANITLRVLLTTKNETKRDIEERALANIKSLIMPLLRKIKLGRLGPSQMANIEMIESNLNQTIGSFEVDIISKNYQLTPTEIQVANLIREGKSSKEIAMLLNTAISTIHTHRDNIRIKLGIKNKKINLRTNLIG